jgi:hypothetical protein
VSIQAVAWALDQDMPARPKLVLVSIANHADHRTGYCWLKAETIGDEASCSPRAVFNFVGDLIRNGYVRKAVRRSEDGKQRANDYWIVFDRVPAEWLSDRTQSATDDEESASGEPDESGSTDAISGDPHAPGACGENTGEPAAEPADMSPGAVGPHAPACSRKSLDEPSKINPSKKEKGGPSQFAAAPRKYQAPPLAPQGALHPDATKPIFVYQGTPAWEAWMAYKRAVTGFVPTLAKTITIDGEKRTGWWFPTLFPPRRRAEKESGDDDDPDLAKLQGSRMHR